MHIKQIIIEGFKSYGKRTVIGPFDPGHNVVVGRNGSGKSNFFAAIQFVLSDEYTRLKDTQRQELMFEGAGPRVISACVEIVFDNTDRRLPIEKNEVFLRRVIGLKKDQYFLNKKMIERTDVLNILETAGFSRSNPYYIVKQGKINEMAMAPKTRLKLLLEIAGINVYEEKKIESYSILKDAKLKLEKIENLLSVIDERLETLKEEVKELQDYLKLDKQRRALEHIIHHQTLSINKDKSIQLEERRTELFTLQKELNKMINDMQVRIKTINKQYKEAQKKLKNAEEETTILSEEQKQLITKKNGLQFLINDLSEEITKNNDNQEKIIRDLQTLEIQILKQEEQLNSILPEYEHIVCREEEITKNLNLNEQKLKELYKKQGRGVQFQNKVDRDQWIEEELKKINIQIEDIEKREEDRKGTLREDQERFNLLSKKLQDCNKQLDDQKSSIDRFNKEYQDLDKQEKEFISKRKDLYRQDQRLQDQLTSLKDELARADYTLRSMFGRSSFDGKNSVEKVLETFRNHPQMSEEVDKYYGLVFENFHCDPELYKAVEVTAGNRLFYHIVETNWFGRQILKEINKQHLPGEASFMPLDTLYVKNVYSYPSSSDAFPMISKLVYEDKCKKAMSYIFGRTLLCRDMKVGKDMARKHKLECVTLEGDQASSKGWLKGGYFSNSKSPLNTQNERAKLVQQIAGYENQLSNLMSEIEQQDEEITICIRNRQRKELLLNRARDSYDKLKDEMNILQNDLKIINKNIVSEKKSLEDYKTNKEIMYTTKTSLENERLQEFTGHLSAADEQEINKLKGIIAKYTEELKGIFDKRLQLEVEKNKIESTLNDNLRRKKDELSQQLKEVSTDDKQLLLTESEAQLKIIEEKIIQNQTNLDEQKNKLQISIEEEEKILQKLKEEKPHEKKVFEEMEYITKNLENVATSENIVKKNLENCRRKIVELGAVPNKELRAKFENMNNKQLFKVLNETKTQLKNYDHVNQKALDQLNTSIEQRKTLRKRKDELDKGYNKILELIEILQQRKGEAIDFTFKQVSKFFSEIFQKLVPVGYAQLVMITGNNESTDRDSISDSSMDSDYYVGIDITVSFTGQSGESRNMNQLSGGQKSLVALTLIFAIQKCDPAPFYLFDEIDSALDTEHRIAVAKMIHELSTDAQFITTTFRPELLQNANKFYGVVVKDNLSFIECVTRESAVNFIEHD